MSQFLYHVPDFKKAVADLADLDAIGLGHVHDGVQCKCMTPSTFPGVGTGALVAVADAQVPPGTDVELAAIVPSAQTWRDGPLVDGRPQYRVGFWNDRRPTAATLQRKKTMGGVPIAMRDGELWTVPVARARLGTVTLPMVMDVNAAGEWFGRVSPQYQHLCDQAKTAYDILLGVYLGTTKTASYAQTMKITVAAMAANYRVGPTELAMLGLVGDEQLGDVLEAVTDWASFKEEVDRKLGEYLAAERPPAGSGSTDAFPATT